jgi:putative copper resistance protein D
MAQPVVASPFPTAPLLDAGWSSLAADAALALAAVGYLAAALTLPRGRPWPSGRTIAFVGGVVAVFLAVGSGIAAHDDVDVPAHVVQHLLLMTVAPPLFVASRVPVLVAHRFGSGLRRLVGTIVRWGPLRRPVGVGSFGLYFGSMWVCFSPSFYRFETGHPLFHDTLHVGLLTVGLLFWQKVVGPGWKGRSAGLARRTLPLVAGMPFELGLGFLLVTLSPPLAHSSLAATRTGGQIFWMGSMTSSAVALAVALWSWVGAEERAALRAERLALPGDA